MAKNSFEIDWSGLKEMQAYTRIMPKRLEKEADAVTKNVGEEGRMRAKKYAPVDTWFMHDNIFTFHKLLYSEVHSTATYSGYVNFGTRYQPAQPFFSQMFDEMQKIFKDDMYDVMTGELKL